MQVFADYYPDTAIMDALRRLVSAETGEEETLASVKRALQEARRKAQEYIRVKKVRP